MLTLLLFASLASATSTYPTVVATWAGAPCDYTCTLCHEGTPGNGTATSFLASALKDRGLVPNDETALTDALDALAIDQVDSDGDGVADTDELTAGTDPNVSGGSLCDVATPQYGCATSRGSAALWPALFGLLLGWARGRRT